jgi:hypothetical protein
VWSALPITISRDVLHGWDTPTPTVTGYVTRTLRSCPQCTNLQSMASVTYNLKLHDMMPQYGFRILFNISTPQEIN